MHTDCMHTLGTPAPGKLCWPLNFWLSSLGQCTKKGKFHPAEWVECGFHIAGGRHWPSLAILKNICLLPFQAETQRKLSHQLLVVQTPEFLFETVKIPLWKLHYVWQHLPPAAAHSFTRTASFSGPGWSQLKWRCWATQLKPITCPNPKLTLSQGWPLGRLGLHPTHSPLPEDPSLEPLTLQQGYVKPPLVGHCHLLFLTGFQLKIPEFTREPCQPGSCKTSSQGTCSCWWACDNSFSRSLYLKHLQGQRNRLCKAFLHFLKESIALTCLLDKKQPLFFFLPCKWEHV